MVNVRNSSDREGSQYDYQNLENMFGKFGFIVSKLSGSKPWTGKVRAKFVKPTIVYAIAQSIMGCQAGNKRL